MPNDFKLRVLKLEATWNCPQVTNKLFISAEMAGSWPHFWQILWTAMSNIMPGFLWRLNSKGIYFIIQLVFVQHIILSLEKFFFREKSKNFSGIENRTGKLSSVSSTLWMWTLLLVVVEKTTRKRMSIRSLTEFPPKPMLVAPEEIF